ncbi:MAG: hypothetical protein HC859_00145 [Bacteroidia bacterium]|nr:hypothetical protein [Bacteroidia bacterium]
MMKNSETAYPPAANRQESVIVKLIMADLRNRGLFKTLRSVGLEGSWCETDLSEVIFACLGIDNPRDWHFLHYYQMLDTHTERLTQDAKTLTASAMTIYSWMNLRFK